MTSDPIARYLSQRTAKLDRRTRLRTMTSSEINDFSLRIYQILGWTFLKLTALPSLLCLAALAFGFQYVWPSLFTTRDATSVSTQLAEVGFAVALALFLGGPLFLIGLSFTVAIVTQLVSDYMMGNVPSPEGALQTARRSFRTVFMVTFWELMLSLSGFIVCLLLFVGAAVVAEMTPETDATAGIIVVLASFGLVAAFIVWFVVLTMHSLAIPAAVIEGKQGLEASRRSVDLLRRANHMPSGYSQMFSMMFVWLVIVGIALFGVYGVFSAIGMPDVLLRPLESVPGSVLIATALHLVPLFLVVWAAVPFYAVASTVNYYERRVRKEGYDIEALASDVWRSDRQNRFEL